MTIRKQRSKQADLSGFEKLLGLVEKKSRSAYRIAASIDERSKNRLGFTHAGFITAMLDQAMTNAVNADLGDDRVGVMMEMQTHFFRPVPNIEVMAEGQVINLAPKLAVAEAYLRDKKDVVYAKSTGTFALQNNDHVASRLKRIK